MRWLAALIVAVPLSSPAATYWVATTGSDTTGDGSPGAPWATPQKALATLPAAGGDEVVVRDGVYRGVTTVSRGFAREVVVRAENPYRAKLTNVDGGAEALRVWFDGPARLRVRGFDLSNAHPTYACPAGRETHYLVHIQDASEVTLEDNLLHGANAPGTCNEVVKINRAAATAYPRAVRLVGNLLYDQANAPGADLVDAVRAGEVEIADNVFFGDPGHLLSQSFITLKRQAPAAAPSSPRFWVHRNVFLHWAGRPDQAFVQLGEDGVAEVEIDDALLENNLFLGDSAAPLAAPFQLKGAARVRVRANTIVGDLPGGSYGFRIGTEGSNPPVAGFTLRNNVFHDPTGTMGTRVVSSYGLVDVGSIVLDRNLYWNASAALPAGGSVPPSADARRVVADPGLAADQSGIVLPRWDEAAGRFPSGSTTIREEFLRLVAAWGALPAGSPAADVADPSDMPGDDIRGLQRDSTPDLGAFELGATAPAQPPDAGAPDAQGLDAAGVQEGDGGTPGVQSGCGCGGAGAAALLPAWGLFLLLPQLRRRSW